MANNIDKRKATKVKLPNPEPPKRENVLPFNGSLVDPKGISFSFSTFDRDCKLFNLGGKEKDGTIGGKWFINLLDCLKNVSSKTIQDLKKRPYCLHPVDWNNANINCPSLEQAEFWQFRVNKSRGRVIGILIDSVFYVVWLDPHHNLTDSEGYGRIKTFPKPECSKDD